MKSYSYIPQNVCSKQISFNLEDGKLRNVDFMGGCPGNLLAISKLLEGADAKETAKLLKGTKCGLKGTSCSDQLAIAIEEALKEQK